MFSKSLGKPKHKTHKTALCIIPPREIWSPIQTIRKKHDRQFYRWMPHINLLYPFKPKSAFSEVIDILEIICSRFKPFTVTLNRICQFQHGKQHHTLWLNVEQEETVQALQNKIWELIPECNDLHKFSTGYTPHLSIGQSKGRDKTKRLISSLQASWKPLRFQVTTLSLIWRKDPPDDRFRIGDTVKLGRSDCDVSF